VTPLESKFKKQFLDGLKIKFPGIIFITPDATARQGMPDVFVIYKDRWAALEFKRSANASRQPNQHYYINAFDELSYASFVYPENQEEVLDALHKALCS